MATHATNAVTKPSFSHLAILKTLWASGAASVGEIHSAISDGLGWSRSSSRKTIERMVDKGLLTQTDNTAAISTAAYLIVRAKKIPTLAGLIQSFASDVLGLDGPLPVSNLVKSDVLSADERAELAAFLEILYSAR